VYSERLLNLLKIGFETSSAIV